MIALCDGHQRRALTTVKVGCKKTFPGRPSAIKFTKFRPKKFFQTFRQICILALLLCAVTAFQLQYWIRFGTWLWLGESKLMLMKLLGGFPILTDLAGQGFQRCVWSFRIEAWQTFRSESEFDSKLKTLGGAQDWSAWIYFGPAGCSRLIFRCIFLNFVNFICETFFLNVICFW